MYRKCAGSFCMLVQFCTGGFFATSELQEDICTPVRKLKYQMKNSEREKNKKNEVVDEINDQTDDGLNFIKEFIEQKKLQNRILKDILENLKHT